MSFTITIFHSRHTMQGSAGPGFVKSDGTGNISNLVPSMKPAAWKFYILRLTVGTRIGKDY